MIKRIDITAGGNTSKLEALSDAHAKVLLAGALGALGVVDGTGDVIIELIGDHDDVLLSCDIDTIDVILQLFK